MKPIQLACVIDDDPMYRFIAQRLLENCPQIQHTIYFENGQVAIDHFRQQQENAGPKDKNIPDLILLDLHMPVLNGWEFLEQYRHLKQTINKSITLYIVSSTIDPADHQKAKANPNVDGVIVKPLSSQILKDLLGNID